MSARAKLAAFAAVLAAAFGLGWGAGALAGPFDDEVVPPSHQQHGGDPR